MGAPYTRAAGVILGLTDFKLRALYYGLATGGRGDLLARIAGAAGGRARFSKDYQTL